MRIKITTTYIIRFLFSDIKVLFDVSYGLKAADPYRCPITNVFRIVKGRSVVHSYNTFRLVYLLAGLRVQQLTGIWDQSTGIIMLLEILLKIYIERNKKGIILGGQLELSSCRAKIACTFTYKGNKNTSNLLKLKVSYIAGDKCSHRDSWLKYVYKIKKEVTFVY